MTQPGADPEPAGPPTEATEADLAEQQAPLRPQDDRDSSGAPAPTADVEADEGDLLEQAIAVPLDEDELR